MAGQVAGMLHEVRPVADILADLWGRREAAHRRAERQMLTLGKKTRPCRILQGGMGVGGLPRRAGRCRGRHSGGCISTADAGYREPDLPATRQPPTTAHWRQRSEKAKEIAHGAGLVAINAMVATQDLRRRHPHRCGSGGGRGGLRRGAPAGTARPCEHAGRCHCAHRFQRKSGEAHPAPLGQGVWPHRRLCGHRGLQGRRASGLCRGRNSAGDLSQSLDKILPEVLAEVQPFEASSAMPSRYSWRAASTPGPTWPTTMLRLESSLATRFIPTYECDASKGCDVLLNASAEMRIIHSPVGMPGRALNTPLCSTGGKADASRRSRCARCLKS